MRLPLFRFSALFVLAILLALPASAQTSRVYFAGYLGLNSYRDQSFQESSAPSSGEIKLNNANSFAGALGVRFSRSLRMEAEISYSNADMSRIEYNNGGSFDLGGELESYITMINMYYDFPTKWRLKPFVGGGLGVGWHEAAIEDTSGTGVDALDDTANLMWQFGGGLKYQMDPKMSLTTSYRYIDGSDIDLETYSVNYGAHEVRIGVEYDIPVK